MRVLACLALAAALARAADLSTIDRTIAAVPKFAAKEQLYALVVLGADAATKIWFVADGEDLYVDRNGNGDLTDDGGPLRGTSSHESDFVPVERSWKLGTLSPRYRDVEVNVGILNPSFRPRPSASNREHMEKFMAAAGRIPHVNLSSIRVQIDGKRRQFGHAMFRTTPGEAPVFHIDGPLTLGLVESILPTVLERGEGPRDVALAVGTPGYSADHAGCFSYLMYDVIPKDARPVIDVEFPATEPGKYLPPRRVTLDGKC